MQKNRTAEKKMAALFPKWPPENIIVDPALANIALNKQ